MGYKHLDIDYFVIASNVENIPLDLSVGKNQKLLDETVNELVKDSEILKISFLQRKVQFISTKY